MRQPQMITLDCQVHRGGFPSEHVFTIEVPGGSPYVGVGSSLYFFDEQGKQFDPVDIPRYPANRPARVAARVLEVYPDDSTMLVSVPSGDNLRLPMDLARKHPQQDELRVPVKS